MIIKAEQIGNEHLMHEYNLEYAYIFAGYTYYKIYLVAYFFFS